MPRVLGIDPGTVSIDICGLEDGAVFLDTSVPTASVARDPQPIIDLIRAAGPVDLIAGPSGYGLPLMPLEDVGERELRLAFLARPGEPGGIGGFRELLRRLRMTGLPVVFTPGVVHLPSVPAHRKHNRIDLGTADKVCAAALALHGEVRRLGVTPGGASFVLVELGGAFTAVLTVHRGEIVDGAGGSSGPPGYRASGALDGEVAYLLGSLTKDVVFSGGVAFAAGTPEQSPEDFAIRSDAAAERALCALVEGVVKTVAAQQAIVPDARTVLLSGRLCRVPALYQRVAGALERLAEVRRVESFAVTTKEAAQGAALLADGLAGGPHRALVDAMRLREATGTVLDHLYVAGSREVIRWWRN